MLRDLSRNIRTSIAPLKLPSKPCSKHAEHGSIGSPFETETPCRWAQYVEAGFKVFLLLLLALLSR